MCDESCLEGIEHQKVCKYLKNVGSVVQNFDEPNAIYDIILPLKILVLKKECPERYALIANFMDHKSKREQYEEYWKDMNKDLPGKDACIQTVEVKRKTGACRLM